MITKAIKQGLTLAVVMSFLVGCSSSDNATTEAPTTGTAPVENTVSEATLSNVVYFDFDQYSLTAESRAVLLAHADKLKGASVAVRLEGHADERGSREYNMALGERRAASVQRYLVLQGVSPAQLELVSYGEEKPAAMGSSEEAWAQNRRVELRK